MNVYQLEKQITGPAEPVMTYDDGVSGTGIHTGAKCWQRFNTPHDQDPEIRMMVHCYNNFMRALEALKQEHRKRVCVMDSCEVCKLIAELEEVK